MAGLRQKIINDYNEYLLCTYALLAKWLYFTYDVEITTDTLGAIIRRDQHIKPIIGTPMEDTRVNASPQEICNYYTELEELVTGLPVDLVANLDEMGYSEFTDARKMTMVVPSWAPNDDVFPLDRTKKRITILHCIFVDGSSIPPLIVIPRKTIEKELLDAGLIPSKCILIYQKHGFIDTEAFLHWSTEFLIPEFRKRIEAHCDSDPSFDRGGVLIIDGLRQHYCEYFEDEAFYNRISPIQLPAHSSDQTQPLDLLLFSISKGFVARNTGCKDFSVQSSEVLKLYSAVQAASTTINIIKSFKRSGICTKFENDILVYILIFVIPKGTAF